MLANYTRASQLAEDQDPSMWKSEQRHFNPKLLIVEIPARMIKTYARKLENIRKNCFDQNTTAAATIATTSIQTSPGRRGE